MPDGPSDPAPGTCVVDVQEPGGGTSPNRILFRGEEVFLNGANVAWLDFAGDFGTNPNIPSAQNFNSAGTDTMLEGVRSAGGNSVRWWVHTDGSSSPEWGTVDGQRMVVSPGQNLIDDLRAALDAAAARNMYIVPALWSFDMLRNNDYRKPPTQDNYRLLSNDAVLQSYIDNALVPLVQALNDHPALFAWELFNEPENMTESWFSAEAVFYGGPVPTRAQLVRTQAKMAAAIHRAALDMGSTALVTTGSKSLGKYNSDVAGGSNWYADAAMIEAADGDPLAILDFYEPHYYNNEGRDGAWSPFEHPADYWGLDKPIVIGEFYVTGSNAPTSTTGGRSLRTEDLCKTLEDLGYAGAWPWQWNERATEIGTCISRTFD